MSLNVVTVHLSTASEQDSIVLVNDAHLKKLGATPNSTIKIQFGSASVQGIVRSGARSGTIRVGRHIAGSLSLTSGARFKLKYKADSNTIRIGPLFGVMLPRAYTAAEAGLFGGNTNYCREVAAACRKRGGQAFFFTASELHKGQHFIRGWIHQQGWRRVQFPVPDVIYNRLSSRAIENKTSVQQFMKDVKSRHQTQIFNEKFLNKNLVFQALQKAPAVQDFLPESHALRSRSILESMCTRYGTIFIKPSQGSMGKGIIRVSRRGNGYTCHYLGSSGSYARQYESAAAVYRSLRKSVPYQVQQGLAIIRVANKPVDFRALVQKNREGQWAITSIVGRIAAGNQFVSNVARGGQVSSVESALRRSNVDKTSLSAITQRMRAASLALAEALDQQLPHHMGELGIDLAVDQYGKVWLLEINSKPSKADDTPNVKTKTRPSARRALEYVDYLSGF